MDDGFGIKRAPILSALDGIVNKDALINSDGTEANWPKANVAVGNPPFLGNKRMIANLGEDYTERLRALYKGRVSANSDLVTYWFEKSSALIEKGELELAGLVATSSIRGGANRKVLKRICDTGATFDTWSDEPWVLDGAAVRVSLISFESKAQGSSPVLNGNKVETIFPDLTGPAPTAMGVDLTRAKQLGENAGSAFQGPVKVGKFDIPGEQAREWLLSPINPNGRRNVDVVKPWVNGMDITRRPSDTWIIDFEEMPESEACMYESPFEYVRQVVKPFRDNNRDRQRRENWWRLGRSGADLKNAIRHIERYVITPRVAKHRLFVWMNAKVLPDSATVAIARDDDTAFGILHSRFHELWTLRLCTWLGVGNDPRYTPSTTFQTFPFPEGLTPDTPAKDYAKDSHAKAIAEAAKELNELRENWLNPPDLIKREPEVVEGYPERILPKGTKAEKELKKRTLTNLYNSRPTWLDNAHKSLDSAVAAAYGWPDDLSDDEVLENLFKLNQKRAKIEAKKDTLKNK